MNNNKLYSKTKFFRQILPCQKPLVFEHAQKCKAFLTFRNKQMTGNVQKVKSFAIIITASFLIFLIINLPIAFSTTITGFNNGILNDSIVENNYLVLNWTDSTNTTRQTAGDYISTAIDETNTQQWLTLNWQNTTGYNPINTTIQTRTFEFNNSLNNNYQQKDANMILWLNLDNNSVLGDTNTTAVDRSQNKNGTITGAKYNTTAKYGNALNFDGINDFIDFGDYNYTDFGTGNFAIAFWIKGGSDIEAIILKDDWLGNDGPISGAVLTNISR